MPQAANVQACFRDGMGGTGTTKVTFHNRTMNLLQGVGASAKMRVL